MISKHILNDPKTIVEESIQGLCYSNPHLRWVPEEKVVVCADVESIAQRQVTLIAGGGSGHEPGYAGYVGHGMLAGAVCGHVFASPSASQIVAAIERVQSPHGTLVVVMNYTGDCLNFGLAVERAKARGIKVEMLIIGDDISVGRSSKVGRRGMAATVLAVKAAGALACQGASLSEVRQTAEYVNQHSATLGVALDHCHVPGGSARQQLPDNEIELGMGIHNEPGCLKSKQLPAKLLVDKMIGMLIDQDDKERSFLHLPQDDLTPVVLMINNLGGISNIEMNLIVKQTVEALSKHTHLDIRRLYTGGFLTSLNMPGVSITLLISRGEIGDRFIKLLDEPANVAYWPYSSKSALLSTDIITPSNNHAKPKEPETTRDTESEVNKKLESAIRAATEAVISAEPEITWCDTVLGDGDCGTTLKAAASAVLRKVPELPLQSASQTIIKVAEIIEDSVGGTSSAIYCIYLNALGASLAEYSSASAISWSKAASHALIALQKYTVARIGDRTLMDVLIPFVETLSKEGDMTLAVEAARKGCEATRGMSAQMGRSSYLAEDEVKKANLPDAGAFGLATLLRGIEYGVTL
ncbi:dihydroxyacetone kinase 1 [Lichtheimia hyalospora FSU 10163]|nr:dihydroxyacetone kinase 1 [Lichtheimia hyalospora FSU 10163]